MVQEVKNGCWWFLKDLYCERYCFKFACCWRVNQIRQGNTVCSRTKIKYF
jgi:hypothetical protein